MDFMSCHHHHHHDDDVQTSSSASASASTSTTSSAPTSLSATPALLTNPSVFRKDTIYTPPSPPNSDSDDYSSDSSACLLLIEQLSSASSSSSSSATSSTTSSCILPEPNASEEEKRGSSKQQQQQQKQQAEVAAAASTAADTTTATATADAADAAAAAASSTAVAVAELRVSTQTCAELASEASLQPAPCGSPSNEAPSPVLFLDVRPQRAYALGHVRGALSCSCSVLQLRRLDTGKLAVDNIFCAKQRKAFLAAKTSGGLTAIVLYGAECPIAQPSSLLAVLLRRIANEYSNVHYICGGFERFAADYPCLVEQCTALPVPLMLPGCDESRVRQACMAAAPCTPTSLPPTQVEPHLYLGTMEDSKNRALLDSLNIRYIINVTPDCPNQFQCDPSYRYMQIPIRDTWNQDIACFFEKSFDFIEEARRNQSAVLVHCMAGISRSATIVIAYLMRKNHTSMNTTYNQLKSKRCTISPNLDFMGHLLQYERRLNIEHESDDSPTGDEPSASLLKTQLASPMRC